MGRARTTRRAAAREEAKTRIKIQRYMDRDGIGARLRAVNQTVTDSVLFWKILKARVAALETFRDATSLAPVRDAAMKVLAEMGVDTRGVQLKLTWVPPRLHVMAVPTMEKAQEIAAAVRGEPASPLVLPSPT
jgi:hypothetical protein